MDWRHVCFRWKNRIKWNYSSVTFCCDIQRLLRCPSASTHKRTALDCILRHTVLLASVDRIVAHQTDNTCVGHCKYSPLWFSSQAATKLEKRMIKNNSHTDTRAKECVCAMRVRTSCVQLYMLCNSIASWQLCSWQKHRQSAKLNKHGMLPKILRE